MAKYDDMSFGKAFAAARKEMGAGETFTWKGKSYTTNYKEEAASDKPMRPKARPEPMRPKARPSTTGGGGADAGKMPATGVKPRQTGGRGDGGKEVSRRAVDSWQAERTAKAKADAKAEAGRKAQEESREAAKKVAIGGVALGAAVLGTRAAMKTPEKKAPAKAPAKASTKVSVPKYNNMGASVGRNWVPESAFTDKPTPPKKSETKPIAPPKKGGPRVGQSKTAAPAVTRGAGGGVRVVGSTKFKSGGGKQAQMIDKALNPFNFYEGGMVKKDKK